VPPVLPVDEELLVLDPGPTEINLTQAPFQIEQITLGVAQPQPSWVGGPDTDGALLDSEPRFANVETTLRLRVWPPAPDAPGAMDTALAEVGRLLDKLRECTRRPGGLPCLYAAAGSSRSYLLHALLAVLPELPIATEGELVGWLQARPVLPVTLTRAPFLRGAAETFPAAGTTALPGPVSAITLPAGAVKGDVEAEAVLELTDTANQPRRHLIWGIESATFDPAAPAPLVIDSDQLVTAGFAGTPVDLAGAYDPDNAQPRAIEAILTATPTAVCGLGVQPHIGTWRVFARVHSSPLARWRLEWAAGDDSFTANPWATPAAGMSGATFSEVDLGLVRIDRAALGAQRWTGRIVGRRTDAAAVAHRVDAIWLVPAGEGYGKVRAHRSADSGALVRRDTFTGLAVDANLHGRTADIGGLWTSTGVANADFRGSGTPNRVYRSTAGDSSPRQAVLGGALTDCEVSALFGPVGAPASGATVANLQMGVIARRTATGTYLVARAARAGTTVTLQIVQVIGMVETVLVSAAPVSRPVGLDGLLLRVTASGVALAQLRAGGPAGTVVAETTFSGAVLRTGGQLASGACGIEDRNLDAANSPARHFGEVSVSVPPAEQLVMHPARRLRIASSGTLREASTANLWGRMTFRGSRLLLPCAGDSDRAVRLVVKARAEDVDAASDDTWNPYPAATATVTVTPRYLVAR
jgi:spore maturation protein SpmB